MVAELYARLMPDQILSGHWDPVWTTPEYWNRLRERGQALERLHVGTRGRERINNVDPAGTNSERDEMNLSSAEFMRLR